MNQQAILTALGINPGTVKADTVRIRFVGENVLVEYDCAVQVTAAMFTEIITPPAKVEGLDAGLPEFDSKAGFDKSDDARLEGDES